MPLLCVLLGFLCNLGQVKVGVVPDYQLSASSFLVVVAKILDSKWSFDCDGRIAGIYGVIPVMMPSRVKISGK